MTRGVRAQVPGYLQNILWYMIETMDVPVKDWMQVFHLEEAYEAGKRRQKIIHSQEQPAYSHAYVIRTKHTYTCNLFVIDNGTHCTMLLADEY